MKQSNKTEWAIWGVCALSFAVTLALLPLLPARIPVHWNVDGQIDGWAARRERFSARHGARPEPFDEISALHRPAPPQL